MKIILSTRNQTKTEQIQAIFNDSPISILTLTDAGIEGTAVEDGTTLKENALKKALFAHDRRTDRRLWAMADDTGIFFDHLNGEPGVRSARWAGENATTEQIMQYALKQMESAISRMATFETVVAVITPSGSRHFFSGKVRGRLLEVPRTALQPNMPYSSIFVPQGTNLVWGEMTVEQVNDISHRGRAFRKALAFLENFLH